MIQLLWKIKSLLSLNIKQLECIMSYLLVCVSITNEDQNHRCKSQISGSKQSHLSIVKVLEFYIFSSSQLCIKGAFFCCRMCSICTFIWKVEGYLIKLSCDVTLKRINKSSYFMSLPIGQ